MYKKELLSLDMFEVLEASFDGIIISSSSGKVLYVNKATSHIMGINAEQMVGAGVDKLLQDKIIPFATGINAVKTKKPFTRLQKYENGKTALVTSSVIYNERTKAEFILTNIRDVTIYYTCLNSKDECKLEFKDGVFTSEKMLEVLHIAKMAASVDTTVLIQGETGVGKDVIARFIHENSSNRNGKFLKINCGSLPEALLESELFGYEGGAFTGANKGGKIGLAEEADNGTLFLDEIGEMPIRLQPKLLELLQDYQFNRIGSVTKRKVNIKVIAATNRDLLEAIQKKEFREDLYYRLNIVPIYIPPIRERGEDIVPLAKFFLEKYCKKYNFYKEFSSDVYNDFLKYTWPGNVREISNTIERLVVTTTNYIISREDLPDNIKKYLNNKINEKKESCVGVNLKKVIADTEKKIILEALEKHLNSYEIAKMLNISQSTAYRKIIKYAQEENS